MKTLRLHPVTISAFGLLLFAAAPLSAQTAPTPAARPAGDEVIKLGQFSVTADRVTGYRAANAVSATGIGTPIIDTPIAINIVTGEFLTDTSAFELRQALDLVPSVRTNEAIESNFRVRGFAVNSLLRNGHFRRQLFANWNIDRVEVIKGASAIFQGSSRPGGIINYVTRKPSFKPQGDAKVTAGSFQHIRAEAYYSAPLNDKIAYRVGGGSYVAEGFRDFWHNRGDDYVAAVTYKMSRRVELTIEFEHVGQHISDQESVGLFVANNLRGPALIYPANDPTGFRYNLGGPDSFRKYASSTVDTDLRVQLTDWLVYRLEGNFCTDNFRVLRTVGTTENAGANAGTVTIRFGDYANYRNIWDVINTLTGRFQTGPAQHTLIFGEQSNKLLQRTPGFGRKNGRDGPNFRYNPTTGAFPEFPTLAPQYPLQGWQLIERVGTRTADGAANDNRRIKEIANAWYLVDTVDLLQGRLKLMGGARWNQLRRTLTWDSLPVINRADSIVQERTTPQAGALFKITPEWSVFGSYSESLEPQNSVDFAGETSGPVEGKGYEFGIKGDAFNRMLATTISVFEIERSNVATRDTIREQMTGQTPWYFFGNTDTVQGAEIDLSYNPITSLQFLLGYSNMWKRETTASQNPARIGVVFVGTPKETFNVWTKYTLPNGALKGAEIGGGVRWADSYKFTDLIMAPSSRSFDMLLRYPFVFGGRKLDAALNIKNVTDEKLYGGALLWSSPREFTFSLSTKF
jgi:iron complex outermembrane receptor protein